MSNDTVFVIESKWRGKSDPWQATVAETSRKSTFDREADGLEELEVRGRVANSMFGMPVEYRLAEYKRRRVVKRGE